MKSTHSMHPDSWRRRRRAQKDSIDRRSIGMQTRHWTRVELCKVRRATGDIAPNEICVAALEIRWERDASRLDAIAEARRESLDLRFDALAHVHGRTVRHMTVRPERVLVLRRSSR